LAGDTGTGKTFLLNRYIRDSLPQSSVPTIGIEFGTKTVQLKTGERVKAQIWDTAGQERYRSIAHTHYRKAVGAILVYDVTREKTFETLKNVRRASFWGIWGVCGKLGNFWKKY
jgi:small GTP-binding protein